MTVRELIANATGSRCSTVKRWEKEATATKPKSNARPRSAAMRSDRRLSLSTHTPAKSANSRPGAVFAASSKATWNGVASSSRIATYPSVGSSEPNSETVWPAQSLRKSGLPQRPVKRGGAWVCIKPYEDTPASVGRGRVSDPPPTFHQRRWLRRLLPFRTDLIVEVRDDPLVEAVAAGEEALADRVRVHLRPWLLEGVLQGQAAAHEVLDGAKPVLDDLGLLLEIALVARLAVARDDDLDIQRLDLLQ